MGAVPPQISVDDTPPELKLRVLSRGHGQHRVVNIRDGDHQQRMNKNVILLGRLSINADGTAGFLDKWSPCNSGQVYFPAAKFANMPAG